MSGFGFGGNQSRGGGGRGRGRGRGGRGRGRGGRGNSNLPQTKLRVCTHNMTGTCRNGNNCNFQHVIQLHKSMEATQGVPQENNSSGGYNNSNNYQKKAKVSSIAIWEQAGAIKIFTASHDGFWRLWNTAGGNFQQEFEHNMNGKVEQIKVVNGFLFAAFEAPHAILPDVKVGMVNAWNLANPAQPPLELHVNNNTLPYAHNSCVTALAIEGSTLVSGAHDGSIRTWKFDNNKFQLVNSLMGHAREVRGLVVLPEQNLLWSAGLDGAIRIWDITKGECQHLITSANHGHSHAVTGLLCFRADNVPYIISSSLDGSIKVWNGTNGTGMLSESVEEGIVSMSLLRDPQNNELLLCGTENGNIVCRTLTPAPKEPKALTALFALASQHKDGPCHALEQGPGGTFYSGGNDGKLNVYQITGDLGLK